MARRPYLAGAVLFVALLLSSALGVDWVDVEGGVNVNAPPALPPAAPSHIASTSGATTPPAPPAPEYLPMPLDYVYLDPGLYGINVYPWYYYYSGFRHQHLYLGSEIGRGGRITQLALFKTYYTYTATFPNVSVKLCTTSVSNLTSTFANNYGGNTPIWVFHQNSGFVRGGSANMWDTVDLTTPFEYNNSSNLIVEVVWQGSASGTYPGSWYNNYGGTRRAGAYNITDTLVSGANYTDYCFYNIRIGFVSVANDVGVSKITAPAGLFCICDTIRPVKCMVRNMGYADQTSVPVYCRIWDNTNASNYIYYDSTFVDVANGKEVEATFPLTAGEIAPLGHNCVLYDTCWTNLATDVRRYNDTANSHATSVNEKADVHLTYNDGTTGSPGCYTWIAANYSQGVRFGVAGGVPISKVMLALSGYSSDPGGPYPCTVGVRLNDGTNKTQGMPGTYVFKEGMQLYSAGYPNDYYNFIELDPPAPVTTDSFYVTWMPQVCANPFQSFDWDAPIDIGDDFGTNPYADKYAWEPLNIGGSETDASGDLIVDAFYGGYLHDMSVRSIDIPAAIIDSGTSFTPEVTFKNAGLKSRPSSDVWFWITDTSGARVTYGSGSVPGMSPGEEYSMTIPPELTLLPTDYMDTAIITCSSHDANPHNDTLGQALFVRYYDVMAQIVRPMAYEVPGLVPVVVKLTNKGNVPAFVDSLKVMISDGYNSHYEGIPLEPGEVKLQYLTPNWVCPANFNGTATAWITAPSDMFHPSDTSMVTLRAGNPGWAEMTPMPAPKSGKSIKDGGCMAYNAADEMIYASKGYKSGDFYGYNPIEEANDKWTEKNSIPLGREGKPPYKGSVICSDGNGTFYLTKGNNTVGFWKYEVATDKWTELTDVPLGPSGKKVKQGAGMAWANSAKVGHACVYLLKGYKNEFYRYDPATAEWTTLLDAPIGTAYKLKWDDGSWLVADADAGNMLYAFKSKYHEFYKYDTDADTWSHALTPMPIPGPAGNKKAKAGCCAAWYNGKIYAFKGANTTEFWRYFPEADTWNTQLDIPLYGYAGMKKKVKAGAALVGYPGLGVFAFKGNKTLECWHYTPFNVAAEAQPIRDGVTAGVTQIGASSFAIAPNPLAGGFATVRYSLPKAGLATLHVFDVTGRAVLSQTLAAGRTGTAGLDLRKLEAGVYLVKVTADGFSTTQKLVVEH
jgi:hypothetical protein